MFIAVKVNMQTFYNSKRLLTLYFDCTFEIWHELNLTISVIFLEPKFQKSPTQVGLKPISHRKYLIFLNNFYAIRRSFLI